tara:strand:+ start:3916 stop:4407 length:492 start_codon:yes stop_codon:yes gene_type:complete
MSTVTLPDYLYPNWYKCLIFTHQTLQQSIHITRHIEHDRYYLMLFDFDNRAFTIVKESIHKPDLFHVFTVLAPELFQPDAFHLTSRPSGPATAGYHPEYLNLVDQLQEAEAKRGSGQSDGLGEVVPLQEFTFQYGPDNEPVRSFDALVLSRIPEEFLLEADRN